MMNRMIEAPMLMLMPTLEAVLSVKLGVSADVTRDGGDVAEDGYRESTVAGWTRVGVVVMVVVESGS